jgi:hypothetical protein
LGDCSGDEDGFEATVRSVIDVLSHEPIRIGREDLRYFIEFSEDENSPYSLRSLGCAALAPHEFLLSLKAAVPLGAQLW